MEIQEENSNSEIISPENNYKFDNYGIVVADSIEDLLYDKYKQRKPKSRTTVIKNNLMDNSSESNENGNNNFRNNIPYKTNNYKYPKKIESPISSNKSKNSNNNININQSENNKSSNNIIKSPEEIKSKEREITHNISLHYNPNKIKKIKEKKDSENHKNTIKKVKKLNKNKDKNKDNNTKANNNINNNKVNNDINNNKINNDINNDINNNNKVNNDINNNTKVNNDINNNINKNIEDQNTNNNNKNNILKIIRCKGLQINNKNKENNKMIKIILNINNKEKKEININPNDNNLIKTININNNKKKNEVENNQNKILNNKKDIIEDKDIKEKKEENKNNEMNNNLNKKNIGKNSSTKMILKNINNENAINKIIEENNNFKNIKKIHVISPSEKNNGKDNNPKEMKKINIETKNKKERKEKEKINKIYNLPKPSFCYIQKIRKNFNTNFIKIIQQKKEEKIILKENKKKKEEIIISNPNLSKCYFIKEKKIIYSLMHIPLQNVINKNYFVTKELHKHNKFNIKKNSFLDNKDNKLKKKNKIDNNNSEYNNSEYNISSSERKNKINNKKESTNNILTEIDIDKSKNTPNVIIKIFNPLNSGYKYGKIDIKTNSSKKLSKSKSSQNIIYNNDIDNKKDSNHQSYLLKFLKGNKNNMPLKKKIKIKKIKHLNNNRYENRKEFTDNQLLKNKEIINALNESDKYKVNCLDCVTLDRRKKYSENLFRNLRLKINKHISKSAKSIKINSIIPEFNAKNIKNKLWNVEKEDHIIERNKKIRLFNKVNKNNSLFPLTNKSVKDNTNNNIKQKNNFSYYSIHNILNNNHIQFPAIDSYFH